MANTSGSTRTTAYDFSVLGNTPITFPIEWDNSKIPGFADPRQRAELPRILGVRGDVQRGRAVLHSAGRRASAPRRWRTDRVFRIDHDEKFNQTTHLQYQPWKRGPVDRLQLALRQRPGGRSRSPSPPGHRPLRDFSGPQPDSRPISNFRAGCSAAMRVSPTLPSPLARVLRLASSLPAWSSSRAGHENDDTIRRASHPATCSIWPWATTISSTATATSGVCSSPPST